MNRSEHVISFAQNAEDVVLWRLFKELARPGFFVDVGAAHPIHDSVTKWFSTRGWTGVNMEPQPELFAMLVADRPTQVNLQVACGSSDGRTELFVARESKWGQSSIDADTIGELQRHDLVQQSIEVEMVTLGAVLDEWAPSTGVDFLKIDVEGAEAAVLAGAALDRHRPRVLVIEATRPDSLDESHHAWEHMVLGAGYQCTLFDGVNRFYCQSDDEDAVRLLRSPANVNDHYVSHREYVLRMSVEALRELLPACVSELSTAQNLLALARDTVADS